MKDLNETDDEKHPRFSVFSNHCSLLIFRFLFQFHVGQPQQLAGNTFFLLISAHSDRHFCRGCKHSELCSPFVVLFLLSLLSFTSYHSLCLISSPFSFLFSCCIFSPLFLCFPRSSLSLCLLLVHFSSCSDSHAPPPAPLSVSCSEEGKKEDKAHPPVTEKAQNKWTVV